MLPITGTGRPSAQELPAGKGIPPIRKKRTGPGGKKHELLWIYDNRIGHTKAGALLPEAALYAGNGFFTQSRQSSRKWSERDNQGTIQDVPRKEPGSYRRRESNGNARISCQTKDKRQVYAGKTIQQAEILVQVFVFGRGRRILLDFGQCSLLMIVILFSRFPDTRRRIQSLHRNHSRMSQALGFRCRKDYQK